MAPAAAKTRLALVITELEVGGAERCLVNLARGLDRTRFEPLVIALAPAPEPPKDALVAELEDADVPLCFLGLASKWRLPSAVARLRAELKAAAPQVVQSMLFHANVVTRLALRRLPPTAWAAGIRVADPSRMRQRVEGRALASADRVTCVSMMVADYALHQLGTDPARMSVIPNGIDLTAIDACRPAALADLGVAPARRAITCIARLTTQKGIDQLLEAAPQILAALPQHDLLLVGDGPQLEELQRLAAAKQVGERVHFCGWRPNVTEILRASDLLVLPSRWEGMPNVVLEAMACGLPVVCTEVEGVREVLGNLAEPQTVPVDAPQLLADKVVKVLAQPAAAKQLGASNRSRVADHFSLASMLVQYETLFSRLADRL